MNNVTKNEILGIASVIEDLLKIVCEHEDTNTPDLSALINRGLHAKNILRHMEKADEYP